MELVNSLDTTFHAQKARLQSEIDELIEKLEYLDSRSLPTFKTSQEMQVKRAELDSLTKYLQARSKSA